MFSLLLTAEKNLFHTVNGVLHSLVKEGAHILDIGSMFCFAEATFGSMRFFWKFI